MSKILENTYDGKKYKKKMKKALNTSKFSLISIYYKDLTKIGKETKDIMEKMKKNGKNMRIQEEEEEDREGN